MCPGSTQAPMNDFMLSQFNSFNCMHTINLQVNQHTQKSQYSAYC